MRHFPSTPTQSFLLATGIIIAVVVGVGIPLGLTGTNEQPSWMPKGTGIAMPSPGANVFKPEMVIITSNAFKTTLDPLAEWKTVKGTPCIVKTTEDIYAQYTGRDHAEKIRNYLKALYANGSLKWVLLAGDNTIVPYRLTYNPDVDSVDGHPSETNTERIYKPTDYYYSDLTGDWDNDHDGNWGESALNSGTQKDEIDWTPELYVGRIPADNQGDMDMVVQKIQKYETDPVNGSWMNNFLLGGAVSDDNDLNQIYNDEAYLVQNISDSYVPSSIDTTLLIKTTEHYTTDPNHDNLTGGNFRSTLDAGQSLVHFQGHGSTSTFGDTYGNTIFSTTDSDALTDNDQVSLMFAAACSTAAYDITGTLMERLLYPPHRGVIGYIGSMRVDWYFDLKVEQASQNWLGSLNRGMARAFWSVFFSGVHQPGKALALMKTNYIHSSWWSPPGMGNFNLEWERKNLLTYTLFGDPELNVYSAQLQAFGNPLPPVVYAGQRLQASVKYNNSEYVVPGATVCIRSGDFYYTSHATGGSFDVRLALEPRTYNMTITGPNMQPYNTTFTTVIDPAAPQILEVGEVPSALGHDRTVYTVNDALNFTLRATDGQSGVGAVILHVSYDNFRTFANFSLTNNGTAGWFNATLVNIPPGNMQYYFTVFDYAENSTRSPLTYSMLIEPLVIHVGFVIMGAGAAVLMGVAISASMVKRWRAWKQYGKIIGERSPDKLESRGNERKNPELA